MGILSFSDRQPKKGSTPTKISPTVLSLLNLTQQDIDAHNKNILQKEAIAEGRQYYKEVKDETNIMSAPPVKLGEIALNPSTADKSDLVDSLKKQVAGMQTALHSDDVAKLNLLIEGFAEGYTESALENGDWQTAIKATDAGTQGGILEKQDLLKKLNELFASDKETRIQIVELTQERLNANPESEIKTAVTQPTTQMTPTINGQTSTPPDSAPTQKPSMEPTLHPLSAQPQFAQIGSDLTQPQDTLQTPKITLAQTKAPEPQTGPDGIILRPVPKAPSNMDLAA